MRYRHDIYDIPELAETEFALAISPCPRIEQSNAVTEHAGAKHRLPEPVHFEQANGLSRMDYEHEDPTQTLSFGWAVALAAAAAVILYVSGA